MRKKICLVTGGSGFIGRFVVEELINRGHHVINFDRTVSQVSKGSITFVRGDLRDRARLQECIKSVDEIYHCAAILGTEELFAIPQEALEINLIGLINILDVATKSNAQKFFYPSSPYVWRNIYSLTKHAGEELCLVYNRAYNLDVRVLRLWNVYGPGQTLFPVRKAVPIFILQALLNEPLEVFGNGNDRVKLIYVVDVASIIADFMADVGPYKQPIDIDPGPNSIVTVSELARKIIDYCGSRSSIKYLPKRFGEFDRLSPRRLKNFIDISPHRYALTHVDTALRATITYYKQLSDRDKRDALSSYKKSIALG